MSYSIQISNDGAKKLFDDLVAFLKGGVSDEAEMQVPRNKRLRNRYSQTYNKCGAKRLIDNLVVFLKGGVSDEAEMHVPRNSD
jgi:hypothetical protein